MKDQIKEANLALVLDEDGQTRDRVRVHLCDYRQMPAEWKGTFDRVVCVEMVEHVGVNFLEVSASEGV